MDSECFELEANAVKRRPECKRYFSDRHRGAKTQHWVQREQLRQICEIVKCQPENILHAHVYGQHEYNAEPFVTIGMESLVHDTPNRRKTFAAQCRKGYVLGTSFEHYRAWKIWMINTRATRVPATVFHKHKYLSNPTATPDDAIIAAAWNLITAIKVHLPHCLQ